MRAMTAPVLPDYEGTGARRARRRFLYAATLALLLLVALGVAIMRALHTASAPGLWISMGLVLVALLWCLRVLQVQWMALGEFARANAVTVTPEDTGVWGVGGPNIRVPGATGLFKALKIDRSVRERDHDEHA